VKHLIRYRNRKIYDSDIRGYVTLEDILAMVLEGNRVVVEDKESGADLTAQTLALVISEVVVKEKKVPVSVLTEIITASYNCVDEKRQTNYTNLT
jgi:polyhydroxyalkanoate synthesis repressor PhaR